MAKTPQTVTPLRQLRLFTGHSQKEFARLVGIRFQNYSKLERGLSTLTRKNAYRIYLLTGALRASLDHRGSQLPETHNGKPYSKQYWEWWREWKHTHLEQVTWGLVKDLLGWTHFVCDVARKEGKLTELHSLLASALTSCCAECGLGAALSRELRTVKLTMKVSRRYAEPRRNKRLAADFGFKDTTYKEGRIVTNDDVWQGIVSERAYWEPWGWFPKALAERLEPLRDGSPHRTGPGWGDSTADSPQSKESSQPPPPA